VFVVHRADKAAVLVEELAKVLSTPLDDPFATELVAVPAKGVEQWLAQRLSHSLGGPEDADPISARGDGVCANVLFPTPRRMLDDAIAAGAADSAARLADWAPDRLTWPVLELLDAHIDENWLRLPRRHLFAEGVSTDRRLSLAVHVARLFDTYTRSRPEMLNHWADGELCLADGTSIDAQEQWQPILWQLLLNRLGGTSPVDLRQRVCQDVGGHPERLPLPQRLSVFGATRLARTDLDLLAAIAEHRDVHLWLPHASPALWVAVAGAPPAVRRADDTTVLTNPLLRSLSRDVRELQQLLRRHAPGHTAVHHESAEPVSDDNLLARLRADLAADRVPSTPVVLGASDRSVQIHACHGRTRQVEVLRETVVGMLADDPTLEPRDVLVMCPDIEVFAPLLAAAFAHRLDDAQGPGYGVHPAERLRVQIADRALHQSNPLLAVLDRLLEFGTARYTLSEVLSFAEHPAVARRFGFSSDDTELLRDWMTEAGVRWGLHEQHRAGWHLQAIAEGTWRRGLDRVLMGAAVEPGPGADVALVAGVLPVDDVDSASIDVLGRFAELVDRLDATNTDLTGTHPPAEWADVLQRATLALAAPEPNAPWQATQLQDVLQGVLAEDIVDISAGTMLSLAELRTVVRDALAERPMRSGFRTGALTVCELVPMRSVPQRVIVLLGLDDGAFPRQSVRDGDDLLARDPWIGDRDPRSEDRQLLLDAICAAGEQLVVIYTGHDPRTGAVVPPAVPLGELLDAVDRIVVGSDGCSGRDAVTVHHPLQPFDARNFISRALGTDRPFSFDPHSYHGAVAAAGQRRDPSPLLSGSLPAVELADVALEDLAALLVHPAEGFLRQRLGLSAMERSDDLNDALPLDLDPLERWQVGDRVLRERLAGLQASEVALAESASGVLPPGPLGLRALAEIGPRVDAVVGAANSLLAHEPESYDIGVDLSDGTQLTGTINGVRGTCLVRVEYSSLAAQHRLAAWVRLLTLAAGHPDQQWQAVTLGRGMGRDASRCVRSTLGPVDPATAATLLRLYVALYRDGLRAPLPAPIRTAAAYAARRGAGARPSAAGAEAARCWNDTWNAPGEQSEDAHVLIYGGRASFDELRHEQAHPDDFFNGWPADEEGDRFAVLSRRLWDPLLRHETHETL
jgi:exodeoxyribonuclease V gamma subunit